MNFNKYIIIFLIFTFPLFPQQTPPYDFEKPAGSDQSVSNCVTNDPDDKKKAYDENLPGITFFGDSRLDYADNYGYNMLYYINNEQDGGPNRVAPNFGIQNFGQSTWTSLQLGDFLSKCMSSSQTNFKTADKFVVNIGGNDWMWSATTITLSVRHAK